MLYTASMQLRGLLFSTLAIILLPVLSLLKGFLAMACRCQHQPHRSLGHSPSVFAILVLKILFELSVYSLFFPFGKKQLRSIYTREYRTA